MATERLGDRHVAPELGRAVISTDHTLLKDNCARLAADSYAIGALVLKALALAEPQALRSDAVVAALPEAAVDLLHRMLHNDYTWRVAGADVLGHSWLAGKPRSLPRPA